MKIKLLILDVDGVLTDGTKVYDKDHIPIYKRFKCKDFTAIKRFAATGIKVIMISGDSWNKPMAHKRNIDFYCTRDKGDGLDKSIWIDEFEKTYGVPKSEMFFIGDDYFDLSMFEKLEWSACPSDAPKIIRDAAAFILDSKGGEGCLVELYDLAIEKDVIKSATMEEVIELDKLEQTSKEMQSSIDNVAILSEN